MRGISLLTPRTGKAHRSAPCPELMYSFHQLMSWVIYINVESWLLSLQWLDWSHVGRPRQYLLCAPRRRRTHGRYPHTHTHTINLSTLSSLQAPTCNQCTFHSTGCEIMDLRSAIVKITSFVVSTNNIDRTSVRDGWTWRTYSAVRLSWLKQAC